MNKKKSLKAIVLSLGLAALMAPATMDAQVINRGLLQNPYKEESNKNHSMMRRDSEPSSTYDISNYGLGQEAPLGSGLALLIGAGLGYAALKRKEDEQ